MMVGVAGFVGWAYCPLSLSACLIRSSPLELIRSIRSPMRAGLSAFWRRLRLGIALRLRATRLRPGLRLRRRSSAFVRP